VYLASLFPALLLAAAIVGLLFGALGHQQSAFALLVSAIVCATHVVVLVMYPIRRTKPLALLLVVMACVSLLCLFLLVVSGRPNYEVHSIGNPPSAPAPPPK
jgi:phosphatidylserine synthase